MIIINTQFKKGVLELLVLVIVENKDMYGYELVEAVSKIVDVNEGTIYPILKRLTNEGLFETYLEESNEGPVRKYYHITTSGKEKKKQQLDEWLKFEKSVRGKNNEINSINIYNFKKKRFKNKKEQDNFMANEKNNTNNCIKLSQKDEDLQDMDFKFAVIKDKRSCLRIYWSYLVESQIILGTFFTENYLDLFVIKFSFFICTFQISFFLNALFYTDEYISNAYHNDGILDFVTGLPKSIYSFIATLIITNLLRMLSSSRNELMRIIRKYKKNDNYENIVDIKLMKLRKKLIVYFILVFLFESFFLYYVTVFCAVYKNSQKYWFFGCLESFGMDSLVAFITCIFLAFFRYISIKYKINLLLCIS